MIFYRGLGAGTEYNFDPVWAGDPFDDPAVVSSLPASPTVSAVTSAAESIARSIGLSKPETQVLSAMPGASPGLSTGAKVVLAVGVGALVFGVIKLAQRSS